MVELFHRRLKDALCAHRAGADWVVHLTWVIVVVLDTPPDDVPVSPSEAVLAVPGQFLATCELPPAAFLD